MKKSTKNYTYDEYENPVQDAHIACPNNDCGNKRGNHTQHGGNDCKFFDFFSDVVKHNFSSIVKYY